MKNRENKDFPDNTWLTIETRFFDLFAIKFVAVRSDDNDPKGILKEDIGERWTEEEELETDVQE